MLARGYLSHVTLGGGPPLEHGLTLAESAAHAALRLDANNASAHASLAWVASHRGDMATALEQAQQAVKSGTNDPIGYLALGHVLVFRQHLVEGRNALEGALRLDPRGPSVPTALLHIAISHYIARDYETAAKAAGDVIATYPDFARPYPYLIASLGQLNRLDEALAVSRRVPDAANAYFDFVTQTRPPWHLPEDHAHLLQGLRNGGWQVDKLQTSDRPPTRRGSGRQASNVESRRH
jgi:tetratricopeptide (TPR) repeat protein